MFEVAEAREQVMREQDVVNYMLEDDAFYEEEEEDEKETDSAQYNEDDFEDYGLSPSDREAVMFDDCESDEQESSN